VCHEEEDRAGNALTNRGGTLDVNFDDDIFALLDGGANWPLGDAVALSIDGGRLKELVLLLALLERLFVKKVVVDAVYFPGAARPGSGRYREVDIGEARAELLDDRVFTDAGWPGDDKYAWAMPGAEVGEQLIGSLSEVIA
jgi:hypothetical protein